MNSLENQVHFTRSIWVYAQLVNSKEKRTERAKQQKKKDEKGNEDEESVSQLNQNKKDRSSELTENFVYKATFTFVSCPLVIIIKFYLKMYYCSLFPYYYGLIVCCFLV